MAFPLPPSPPPRYILVAERKLSTKETMFALQIKNLASFGRDEGHGGIAPDSTVGTTTAPAAATSGKPAVAAIPATYRSTSVMTRTATICSLPASLAPTPSKQPNSSLSSIVKAFRCTGRRSARFHGTDIIGITSDNIIPCLCESRFSSESIADFLNLLYAPDREHIHWLPL